VKKGDRHLQLRLSPETYAELNRLAAKLGLKSSEVIRGVIYFGLPIFEAMTELQGNVINRLAKSLKQKARKNDKKTTQWY